MASLTRAQIGTKALQKVGNLARGQTANTDDLKIATDALDLLITELPVHGYVAPDPAPATDTGLADEWGQALVFGVAAAIGDEFGAEPNQRVLWLQEWAGLRDRIIAFESPELPDMTVDDGNTNGIYWV